MTLSPALALAAGLVSFAAGQEPGLLAQRELTLPLQPVSIELHPDGRIKALGFAFIPFGLRSACHGKFVKECRTIARDKGIAAYARRKKEPEQILEVTVGGGRAKLLEGLARHPAVKALREKVDVTWTAAGTPKEYALDRKRAVSARVRWRILVNLETLELLELPK